MPRRFTRRNFLTAAAALSAGASLATEAPPGTDQTPLFTNPLDVKIADPCMIQVDGVYYLYGTASLPEDADQGMPVWSSRDMVRWQCRGWAFRKSPDSWGTHWFWGPDVHRTGSTY